MLNHGTNGVCSDPLPEVDGQVTELKALRLLVGGLAHDFNNLLTAIQGHATLLAAEMDHGGEASESVQAIYQASDRAAAIARQLQNLSRRGPIRQERVDVHQTISEVVRLLQRSVDDRIGFLQDLQAPYAVTMGDPEQIYQMLLNLALNARDSMPDGGTIWIGTSTESKPSGGLLISVRDSGCGIPEEIRERIFEPYFTTRPDGTGLGLAVVSGIVRKHRGEIQVDSVPGGGSTFRVRLPLAARCAAEV